MLRVQSHKVTMALDKQYSYWTNEILMFSLLNELFAHAELWASGDSLCKLCVSSVHWY